MRQVWLFALLSAGLMAGLLAQAVDRPQTAAVTMRQFGFVPATLAVAPGTKVTWTNEDNVPHTVTAKDGRFDSGPVLPGKTFEWTSKGSGEVAYHCIFHPSMTAALTLAGQ